MKVAFNGYDSSVATFISGGTLAVGAPVKMSANGTVVGCNSGDLPIGFVIALDDDCVSVQTRGYVTAASKTAPPPLGCGYIKADGNGGVTVGTPTTGRFAIVLDADTSKSTVGVIL